MSCNYPVNSGVPQGSIIGPLLFVLFINDINDLVSEGTNITLYADDTKIWREIHAKIENIIRLMGMLADRVELKDAWVS